MTKKIAFFTILASLCLGGFTQDIPNNDFENWTGNNPDEWDTSNKEIMGTQFTAVEPLDTDVYSGDFAAGLTTVTENITYYGEFPLAGVITLGDIIIDEIQMSATIEGGIPFTDRPDLLKGYYKTSPGVNDSASIMIGLSKWNTSTLERDTIGEGYIYFTEEVNTWTEFEVPIEWTSTEDPDSMNIIVSSSCLIDINTFVEGSFIAVDSLWLEDIPDVEIIAVESLDPDTVPYGTDFADLPLPATVEVTLENFDTEILDVTWLEGSYDGNTTGVYAMEGDLELVPGIINPNSLLAEKDIVVDEEKIVTEVETLDPDTVPFGTDFADLPLPATVEVTFDGSETEILDVNWYEGNYDGNTANAYTMYGDLVLTTGITNPDDLMAEKNIIVDEETGIMVNSSNNIDVYPNPANTYVNIDAAHNITACVLYDITGRTLKTKKLHTKRARFNVKGLPEGYYLLNIKTTEKEQTLKLIVN